MEGNKYSPIKLAIIILLGFAFFVIFGILYRRSQYTETWYICTFPSAYDSYTETLKFRYKEDTLYGYYREETFLRDNDKDLEERYNYFKQIAEDLKTDKDFTYTVEKKDDRVNVNTYINVVSLPDFFENYIESFSIKRDDSIKNIEEKLKKSNYSCKIKRK